jgi:hypothetical protein
VQLAPAFREELMLFNHAIVAVGGDVLVVQGGGNCFSFGTHFNRSVLCVRGVDRVHLRQPPCLEGQ